MSTLKVRAYANFEKGGPKKEHHFELGTLPDDYVDVKVTHSGVCYTDIGATDFEFGPVPLPLVGGHEVAGIVHAVGKNVTNVKVGDRVGCHNIRSACQQCSNCTRGIDQMCSKLDALAFGNGGFAEYTRMQAAFVYKLPDTLPNEYAASLMCAGATMWAAFTDPGIQAGHRVAILGIGGLGHLGIKFARAMGCEVAAISTTKSKEEEAKKLGAHHFIVSSDEADMKKFQDYFDFVIVTATKEIDYAPLVGILRVPGTLVIPGIPGESVKLSAMALCWKGIRVFGVPGCTRKAQKQMIDFCGVHKVYPQIETLPISQINEAFDRVRKGTPRFRVVLTL
eukprot:Phypoly_transcript_10102.p1 GENE.Phypoly_transcript_10102~~Phypoly_transcript_10102.p1  ORF type:complete len:337 (+),score=45.73 Phypoly_transcript_10102:316-1326(+)